VVSFRRRASAASSQGRRFRVQKTLSPETRIATDFADPLFLVTWAQMNWRIAAKVTGKGAIRVVWQNLLNALTTRRLAAALCERRAETVFHSLPAGF